MFAPGPKWRSYGPDSDLLLEIYSFLHKKCIGLKKKAIGTSYKPYKHFICSMFT